MFRARACISSETVVWSPWNLYAILNLSVYAALLHLKRIMLYLNFQISYKEVVNIWKMGGQGVETMDYILIKRTCWVKGWCTSWWRTPCKDSFFLCELCFPWNLLFSESSLSLQLKESKCQFPYYFLAIKLPVLLGT